MRTLIILNPSAGGGDAARAQLEECHDLGDEIEICETAEAGDARRFAAEGVAKGFERVIAAGGDGTLNEVLNGIAPHFARVELGLIPLGTGNDLARTLGIPRKPGPAIEMLATARARPIDVARFDNGSAWWFLNMSAGGFSGEMNELLNEEVKNAWGPLSYIRTAFEALTGLEPFRTTLVFEPGTPEAEAITFDAINVVVANGRHIAAGLQVAPQAEVDDGLFEVLAIRPAPVAKLSLLASKVLVGNHLGDPLIFSRQARRVEVFSEPEMRFNVDGEHCGATPARFEILPGAVRFLVGSEE